MLVWVVKEQTCIQVKYFFLIRFQLCYIFLHLLAQVKLGYLLMYLNLYIADIENFVEEHLKAVNTEVDRYNSKIDTEAYPDLFD